MCTTSARDYCVASFLINITQCHSFVYKRLDLLTDKMSDSDECFDILKDIKSHKLEPLAKRVTDSINCEELTAASADVDLEQSPVPPLPGPGSQQELD